MYRTFLRLRAGSDAARIANGDGTGMVIGHGPEHVAELVFVFGLHVDDSRNRAEVADIEKAVMSRAVVAGESRTVHAKRDVEVLQRDIMDDHVVGALEERGVNGQEGLHPAHGESAGEEGRVLLGDSHVEAAVRMAL